MVQKGVSSPEATASPSIFISGANARKKTANGTTNALSATGITPCHTARKNIHPGVELVEDQDQAKVASEPFGTGQKSSNEPTEPQIQSHNSPTRAPLPTPIIFDKLEPYLTGTCYDQEELKYLKEGFRSGLRLGFQPKQFNAGAIVRNPPMDADLEKIMMTKISQDVEAGRVAGPFSSPPLENFRCSPVRLEPKKKPREYRFIHNLSHPYGSPLSINAGIPQDNKSVNYATLDDAMTAVLATGPNTFFAKTESSQPSK